LFSLQYCNDSGGKQTEDIDASSWSNIIPYLRNIDPQFIKSFWIGLTDLQVEGKFQWFSSGQIATFFNWYSTEPKNSASVNCVQTLARQYRFWGMDICSNLNYALCETGSNSNFIKT
jgi:hypothetical protein